MDRIEPIFEKIFLTSMVQNVIDPKNFVIAGGAVVELASAGDIDVFILNSEHGGAGDWERSEKAAREFMADLSNLLPSGSWKLTDSRTRNEGYNANRRHLGTVYSTGHKPIQVMDTEYISAGALIDSFDLSIHAWAIVAPHYVVGSIGKSTGVDEQMRVNRFTTPSATLARLNKISARYPHAGFNISDVEKLVELIKKEKH